MNKKARFDIYGIIILVGFGFFLYWAYTGIGSLVNVSEQTKSFEWAGNDVILTSPYFGKLTSGNFSDSNKILTGGDRYLRVCGDSNGKVVLDNSYSVSSDILLTSSISSNDASCSESNYIRAKITFKTSGNLSYMCSLSATPVIYQDAKASCVVGSFSKSIDPSLGRKGLDAYSDPMAFSSSGVIFVNSGDVLDLYVNDLAEQGSSSSKLNLNFYPDSVSSSNSSPVNFFTSLPDEKQSISEHFLSLIREIINWFRGLLE